MPKRIIGVSGRLLSVAKEEFLSKGYENSSVRDIAAKADTSPRAIYTRFKNKEALFKAIVKPVYDEFMDMYIKERSEYWERARRKDFSVNPQDIYIHYLEFAYSHKDEFVLILKQGVNAGMEDIIKALAECEIEGVRINAPQIIPDSPITYYDEATGLFIETITYSFYKGLFEPLIRGMDIESAKDYITKLTDFYNTGIMYTQTGGA